MVVDLRERVAVAAEAFAAFDVGANHQFVGFRRAPLHPAQQRRSKVVADRVVVIGDAADAVLGIHDARGGVGGVAFRVYALVPVVIRISGILQLNGFQPWVFAGRLIEVPVYADVSQVVFRRSRRECSH